jgi:hypothetical protein
LVLTLRDGTAEQRNGADPEALLNEPTQSLFFGEFPIELPLGALFGEGSKRRIRIKEMTFTQLMELRADELAIEAQTGEGMTEKRMKVQDAHAKEFCDGVFSVFFGDFWSSAGDTSWAQGELCESRDCAGHCDVVLLFDHRR